MFIFVCFLSGVLQAEDEGLYFSDSINFLGNNHSNNNRLDASDVNVDLRVDNRFIASYATSNFKTEVHLLTSYSNFKASKFEIPITLVVEDDRTNLFRMTRSDEIGDTTMINRIDRLNFSFFNENYEFTVGRSTLTWSRGRIFHVTDFFNPQNPGFYDGDYKIGTDLAYLNFSLTDQDNISLVANPKRPYCTDSQVAEDNNCDDVTMADSTFAFRYSHNNETSDYSFMLAQYLNDYTVAAGLSHDFIAGSVIRTDISVWYPEFDRNDGYTMLMLGVEKSFDFIDRSTTLYTEYYYNEFGYDGSMSIDSYGTLNPTMMKRLLERDTYLIGRQYLAVGLIYEITPYINLSYSNMISLKDGSSFNFMGVSYSYNENLDLGLNMGIPFGGTGDEFGKICDSQGNNCVQMTPMVLVSMVYNF